MNPIILTIDAIPPTLNEWTRTHWTKQRAAKCEWQWRILACVLPLKIGKPQHKKAKVTITYQFTTNRRRDIDNYAPKFIMDALVNAGLIKDDRADCIQVSWGFEQGTKRQTIIQIEPREE